MRILSRRFLASYIALFALALSASTLTVVIVEMLLNFDQMVARREGFGGIAAYLVLRVPAYYLRDVVPVSAFAAGFLCLGLPARWSEITAIKAGGIAPQRLAIPLLTAAAALSLANLVVNETLVLDATREWNRLDRAGDEITFRRGSFWYHRAGVIYNVQEADRATRMLHGVRVFELTPEGRLRRSILADRVHIESDRYWRFLQATVRTFDPANPAAAPVVERAAETTLEVAQERDLALLDASANTLSMLDLREYIAARAREGRDTTRYRAMWNARLAEPATVLLFTLLAIPIGLGVDQNRNIAVAALQGIAVLLAFFTVKTVGSAAGSGGVAWSAPIPWLALTAFGGWGAWRLSRVPC